MKLSAQNLKEEHGYLFSDMMNLMLWEYGYLFFAANWAVTSAHSLPMLPRPVPARDGQASGHRSLGLQRER